MMKLNTKAAVDERVLYMKTPSSSILTKWINVILSCTTTRTDQNINFQTYLESYMGRKEI